MSSFLVPPVRNCVLVCVITMGGLESRSAWAQRDGNDKAAATETSGPREAVPAEMPVAQVELPDAPLFMPVNFEPPNPVAGQSASLSSGSGSVSGARDAARVDVAPTTSESVPLNECPYDTTHARECRVHWPQLLISSAVFLTFQSTGNLYTGYWYRYETGHGKWFDRWINSAADWRWDVWDDDNPKMDQYVGHPMMGSITNYLWIQNDPKGMTLDLSNTWPYWRSRLRATAFTTAYSFAWKLGPFGEAGIGHNGDHLVPQGAGKPWSNETGWVELLTTPVGGLLWTVAEDSLR